MEDRTKLAVRTGASAAVVGGYTYANRVFINETSLMTSKMAVSQLQDVDQPVNLATMQTLSGAELSGVIALAALGAIWWKPVKDLITRHKGSTFAALFTASAAAAAATAGMPTPAHAYYDTTDNPEFIGIPANSTAFVIPVQGANLANQAQFDSEAYLNDNYDPLTPGHDHGKVATKRIQIPHMRVKTAWNSADYFVPTVQVYLFDRTPILREWNDASDRGTSAKKEGFHLESKESVNIDFGVVIEAEVTQENAAKFAYHFGAKITGPVRTNDPATTFASVIEMRSLADVMDTNVRGRVQALVAREFGKRTVQECMDQKKEIMDAVRAELTTSLAADGITLKNVGFDTPLNYENADIQTAIDDNVINTKRAAAASIIAPALPVMQTLADIQVKNSFAEAVKKWNGQLNVPSVLVMSPEIAKLASGLMGSPAALSLPKPPAAAPQ